MESTLTDLSDFQNEEIIRRFMEIVTPMIERAVGDGLAPVSQLTALAEEMRAARAEMDSTREDLEAARNELKATTAKFVTAGEVKKIGQDIGNAMGAQVTGKVDTALELWRKEDEARTQEINARFGEVNAAALRNEQRLNTIEADHERRFKHIEARLERIDTDIDQNVKKVAAAANTMNLTFAKFLEKYEVKAKENARDIEDLQKAQELTMKRLMEQKDDTSNVRLDVDGLRADIATKVTTTDLKVKDIQRDVEGARNDIAGVRSEQAHLRNDLTDIQVSLKAALWLVNTWAGRAVVGAILALLIGSNIIH